MGRFIPFSDEAEEENQVPEEAAVMDVQQQSNY